MEVCKILIKQFWILALLWLALRLKPTSSQCDVCMKNKVACRNTTAFSPCFGGDIPSTDVVIQCPSGLQCTNHSWICVDSNELSAACPKQDNQATEMCISKGSPGLYSLNDTSCSQYLSCTNVSGEIQNCPESSYFNSELRMCQLNKPSNCI